MRDISPVETPGVASYYTDEDLALQMIIYGDISSWRCARMMRIAEEQSKKDRMVLVLTENESVSHLATLGFLVYRPSAHGYRNTDIAVLIGLLQAGQNIVIDTNLLEDERKYEISRELVGALSTINVARLSLIVESTEQFYARRWNYGNRSGVPVLNNLLKRFKAQGSRVAFGAESPEEIAIEIARSCGTSAVGRISNHDRVRAVGKSVDPRLPQHADRLYGIKLLDPNDFYLYNRTTAPRIGDRQAELPLNVPVTGDAIARAHIVPCWIRDHELECGFDPNSPTPGPELDSEGQEAMIKALQEARESELLIAAKSVQEAIAKTGSIVTANDNAGPRRYQKASAPQRLSGSQYAVERVEAAGIPNAKRMISMGLKAINSRGGRLNVPLHGGITAKNLADRIIKDELLREAVTAAASLANRFSSFEGTSVSGVAYAAAYYQALCEHVTLARAFHHEMFVEGQSRKASDVTLSPRAYAMKTALCQLGAEVNTKRRSESQYLHLRNAWGQFRAEHQMPARKAA